MNLCAFPSRRVAPLGWLGRLESLEPGLHERQRALLHGEHRRVNGSILSDEVGAVEAIAHSNGLLVGAASRRAIRRDGRFAPWIACETLQISFV